VNSNTSSARPVNHFPDGLDETAIDALIAEAAHEVATAPVATSALMDGSAAERRRRRMERRAISAVVRSLPVRPVMAEPQDEVA
jgi:ribosomal protein L12E/L44/L45/RPP1/RPP2